MVRRALVEGIGRFDEAHFGEGYGEENDYALRARKAGWRLALADDTYIQHAQSKSYSHERRLQLYDRANAALTARHGQPIIDEGTAFLRADRVLEGVRARARTLGERRAISADGRARFAGKRVLFVLPVMTAGGGANIVIGEARAMRAMGVHVALFNVDRFRSSFERAYPDLDLPVVYGRYDEVPQSLTEHVAEYDAMIGTIFASVRNLDEVSRAPGGDRLAFGYYVQDFEPYFFEPGSENFHRAWQSYKLMPDLVRFTKTEWNRREIETLIGVDCHVVGPSFDADLFRPRPRPGPEPPDRPLRVAAMIRPETPYRNPHLTMSVLGDAARRFGSAIDVRLFGCDPESRAFRALPQAFPWRSAGALSPRQMATFLNEIDVFADFSSHQAMGLTALEAMACGAAVAVSGRGGAGEFARDQGNCLLVDASSEDACRAALDALVQDEGLRRRLQGAAIQDAARYYPERPARNILAALFGTGGRGSGA
jgi:glycosyltransferase involved in cell wall biosynthesis